MISLLVLFSACLGQEFPFRNSDLPIDVRVEDLISRLTLEEKVNQLMDETSAITRLDIPPYGWWNEALHGIISSGVTVFPQVIGLAATFDDAALYEMFTIVSDEGRAKYNEFQRDEIYNDFHGLTFWAPNVNIFRDPRWGRGQETYGEDPYLTARMGISVIKGLQGNDSRYLKAHAGIKHFAVHSGPEPLRHQFDVYPTTRDLYTTYLPAFEAAVKETDVGEVMCAYNSINGKPACESDLLFGILREKWGFKGLVTSDCDAVNDFFWTDRHAVFPDAEHAAVAALRAGTDLECGVGTWAYKSLVNATNMGLIEEAELDVSLRRLFRARMQLGMFDDPALVPWSGYTLDAAQAEAHRQKSLEIARRTLVLLKNAAPRRGRNPTLPLQRNAIRRIAVIGPNANLESMQWGNYNGYPPEGTTVTILEGIKALHPDAEVVYAKGCDHVDRTTYEDDDGTNRTVDFAATAKSASSSDAIVFVAGITSKLEGEESVVNVHVEGFDGGDRTTMELPAVQSGLLQAVRDANPDTPIVLVVCAGSPIVLTKIQDYVDAVVYAWYPGQRGGTAVAEVLFGDVNPSGHLPLTFYAGDEQVPPIEDYHMANRTYRYLTVEPLYPFGFGLSYTTFEYSGGKLSKTTFAANETVTLTLDVRNTGPVDGEDVVQVYVRYPDHPLEPIKALKGFKRISVPANGIRTVEIPLPPKTFETFDDAAETMTTRPGNYVVGYGSSSKNTDLSYLTVVIT